jgi:hypothetical protein
MVSLEARTVFHWTPLTSSVYVQYVTCYSKLPFSTGKLKPVMGHQNHLTARPMYFPRLRVMLPRSWLSSLLCLFLRLLGCIHLFFHLILDS